MPTPKNRYMNPIAAMSMAMFGGMLSINVDAQQSSQDRQSLNQSNWLVSATNKTTSAQKAVDDLIATRWTTSQTQQPGQAFIVDLGASETFDRIELDAGPSESDYPRAYSIHVSSDGENWGSPVAQGTGTSAVTDIELATQTARFVKITQEGRDNQFWWSIHELDISNTRDTVANDQMAALDRSQWRLSSNNSQADLGNAIDSDIASRWTTNQNQQNGQYMQIDLSKIVNISQIVMNTSGAGASELDYPRGLDVDVSADGQTWRTVSRAAGDAGGITTIDIEQAQARYIKLIQTGADGFYWWSVHDINVFAKTMASNENLAPSVSFTRPSTGRDFIEGQDLLVEVVAQDDDGSVASVDLYLNDAFIRKETSAPYQWGQSESGADLQLQDVAAGTYDVKAVATDNRGAKTTVSTIVQFLLDDDVGEPVDDPTVKEHRYQKNEGPDINPLKGWNSGWWDDRPEASVGFQYIKWKDFEPTNGNFNFDAVEDVINRSGSEGRHFVLRLYCDWHGDHQTSRGCPDWMYSQVGVKRIRGDNGRYITDYNDSKYINEAIQAIQALGQRYDDDPRVHSFQLGVLGYWGEWHTFGSSINGKSYEISEQSETRILNAYRNAFSKAKLVARYPYRSILRDTTDLGFHNDFFRPNNGHSDEFDTAVEDGERWKDGPIGGEIPPGLSSGDFDALYLTSQGQQMVEKGRYSTMKPTSVAGKHLNGHMRLHRRMGYNFQIDSALFAEQRRESERLSVLLNVKNIGVAPLYYAWQAQFAILDANNNAVKTVTADRHDLTKYLPNASFELKSNMSLSGVVDGNYKLAVRIIQPGADKQKPARWRLDARNTYIEFANHLPVVNGAWNSQNQLIGGWSVLGNVEVR